MANSVASRRTASASRSEIGWFRVKARFTRSTTACIEGSRFERELSLHSKVPAVGQGAGADGSRAHEARFAAVRYHFLSSGQSLLSSGLAASSGEMVATSL